MSIFRAGQGGFCGAFAFVILPVKRTFARIPISEIRSNYYCMDAMSQRRGTEPSAFLHLRITCAQSHRDGR
jgi:hypothetical protein